MRALEQTKNLIELYLHTRGEDEVPVYYNVWACLSMIAAAVGNRVRFWRIRDVPLYPNLYVLLIGDSGSCKNRAVDGVTPFVEHIAQVGFRRMKLTAQILFDMLSEASPLGAEDGMIISPRVYLVQPELKHYFPKGEHAEALIETLTELYGGSFQWFEGTRMHGIKKVDRACINWFAGTPKDWLLKVVTPEAITSGFFARICVVYPEKNPPKQCLAPTYPPDYYEVIEHIKARVLMLSALEGDMSQTSNAKNWMRSWMHNRKEPTDDMLRPSWKRQRELIYRLAMLFSLADGGPYVIREHHVIRAERLSRMVIESNMPELIEFSSQTRETKGIGVVREIINKVGEITQANLTKRAYKRGINAAGVRAAVQDLKVQGSIVVSTSKTGALVYNWIKES